MERKPIKRSGYLVALSRDHHNGLLFCWKIKQGLANAIPVQRLDNYARFFWENHLKEHFMEEELLLFNQLAGELTQRAKAEHLTLTGWFDRIAGTDALNEQEYLAFVEALTTHIRFEEREVFPFLEKGLPEAALIGIRDILTRLHSVPFDDNYPDEFWVNNKK